MYGLVFDIYIIFFFPMLTSIRPTTHAATNTHIVPIRIVTGLRRDASSV